VAAALLLALTACNSPSGPPARRSVPSPRSKVIQGGPNCRLPRRRPDPEWLPRDLPLPPRTYFYKPLRPRRGLDRGLFVLRIEAKAFRSFINKRWKRAGIRFLRPDAEPGEVEDIFTTPRGTGVFKANDVICSPPYTRLLLIYGVGVSRA
jgi:hypothetical protein